MRLSNLKEANEYEVRDWLTKELELTQHQKSKIVYNDSIRLSPFYFYKQREKSKYSPLWRLTIVAYIPCYILLFVALPFKWMVTGTWGYGRKFIDNFHAPWSKRIGF